MSIYAIADLHLSFAPDSDKPMDVFGSRWNNHPERIKENWCSTITEDDTVVVAGDISWGLKLDDAVYDLDWVDALPGHKVMLKGNHDLWWSGINRMNGMYDSITFLQNDAYRVSMEDGSEVWICGSRGWLTPDDDDFTEDDDKIYKRETKGVSGVRRELSGGCKGRLPGHYRFSPLSACRKAGNVLGIHAGIRGLWS